MSEPSNDAPHVEGHDVVVEPSHLDDEHDVPASSDPAQMTDDDTELGGVGGPDSGGAG